MKTKIVKRYVDHLAGFPVIMNNVTFVFLRDEWIPKIHYEVVDREIIRQLIITRSRFSGAQVRFIRKYFNMTLKEFADRLGVSHVAVIKWEKKSNKPASMAWGIEKDIRLFMHSRLSKQAKDFYELYSDLEIPVENVPKTLIIDTKKLAA